MTNSALRATGLDQGMITTFLASQAMASGIPHEDFETVCVKAYAYSIEFEKAAVLSGVVRA